MQCPWCKNEIADNSIRCKSCGKKVGSICKVCNTYNLITAYECSSCGNALLRICSECGSANRPDAKKCRKCGIEFISKQSEADLLQPIYFADMHSQQKIKTRLIDGIKDVNTKIITISGESGCGKNVVLKSAISTLKDANLVWLIGKCTQITQLSPFGYFQDLLLSFFNINNFCSDTLQLKKNSIKFFKQDFPTLSNEEILDLLNILYPEKTDIYENIYYNKVKIFNTLKKVISTITDKIKTIFVVDNIENIDGLSYDFIKELLNDQAILSRCKFIFLSSEQKPAQGWIATNSLTIENYLTLTIAPFTPSQVEILLSQYKDKQYGKDFINTSIKLSGGNPSIVEQIVCLQEDISIFKTESPDYSSFESIIKYRLKIMRSQDYEAYRMLVAMSVLGVKFYPAMLENFDNIPPQEFERIITLLVSKCFISQINSLSFEFKSTYLWKTIVSIVKEDVCFEEILNILYEILSIYKQSSIALLGYIVQKLNNNDNSFEIWTLLMKHASYIGDISLYIIAQKQSLKLIENKTSDYYSHIKKNIYTRIGKLLEPIDHNAAFEYLQKAVIMLNDNEDSAHIDLLGYIANCAMKSGNYCGVIECVEAVLNKLPDNMYTEKVLVKTRLTVPLLKLGNYGQLINTTETEVLNEVEKLLIKGKNHSVISLDDIFTTWISIYFSLAEALAFQGDSRAFSYISDIYEILDKNNKKEPELVCKTHLLLALANTIKGDIKMSKTILDDVLNDFSLDDLDNNIVSRWNLIDILNKFIEHDYKSLQDELFNVAAYANNINDNFTKNILKTLLAKVLKENNQTKKALEVLEEQVSYFAKEKVATGVLLSWYLIAEIKLISSGTQFALDIANKALDIASSPNINNYFFIAMFNKLIGEIYLAKQDFESAKVYIEKSIFMAKQFNLLYLLVNDYLLCAKLYQELALPKTASRGTYIKQALKMFQQAKNVQIVADQPNLQRLIKENLNILTSFCKLNGIVLKKEA